MSDFAPPVAFHFSVVVSGDTSTALAFSEVSGLETRAEPVGTGQQNQFVRQLPKGVRHSNLKLKRGTLDSNAPLVAWAKQVLESGLVEAIVPRDISITLVDAQGASMARWLVSDAYPVKWSVAAFDAMANQLMIETLEFAFRTVTREM